MRSPRNVVSLGGDYTIPLEIGGKLVAGADVSFRDKEYFLADRQSSADKDMTLAPLVSAVVSTPLLTVSRLT